MSKTLPVPMRVPGLRKLMSVATFVFLGFLLGSSAETCAEEPGFTLLGKAAPDEFYHGLGGAYYPLGQQPPNLAGQPKVNQAYIWGMTRAGDDVWFGTAANPVSAAFGGIAGFPIPMESKTNVSEYWLSKYPDINPLLRVFLGDWRPPEVYRYHADGGVVNMTPDHSLIAETLGFRSAGATNEVVLIGGPSLWQLGINLFAFDAGTGEFLDARTFPEFSNIRNWIEVDGNLYTATLNTWTLSGQGSVLRWSGSRSAPFEYEVVGDLDNDGATLCVHDGRLFALTWSGLSRLIELVTGARAQHDAGVWMSPPLSSGGLTSAARSQWTKVWSIREYEPDPLIWRSVYLGAAASHDGYLVWGTLQIPGTGAQALKDAYGWPANPDALAPAIINSFRPAALFRGKVDPSGQFQAELLYGSPTLPVYTRTGDTGFWSMEPNGMGHPRLGGAGFDDPFNMYVWSMLSHENRLWIGTFDMSFILFGDSVVDGNPLLPTMGADLLVMDRTDQPVTFVSQTGCGNVANNGIRVMLNDGDSILLGTATSANLLTNPHQAAVGGWEFQRFDPSAAQSISRRVPATTPAIDWSQMLRLSELATP